MIFPDRWAIGWGGRPAPLGEDSHAAVDAERVQHGSALSRVHASARQLRELYT
jgi:hypothetical protein